MLPSCSICLTRSEPPTVPIVTSCTLTHAHTRSRAGQVGGVDTSRAAAGCSAAVQRHAAPGGTWRSRFISSTIFCSTFCGSTHVGGRGGRGAGRSSGGGRRQRCRSPHHQYPPDRVRTAAAVHAPCSVWRTLRASVRVPSTSNRHRTRVVMAGLLQTPVGGRGRRRVESDGGRVAAGGSSRPTPRLLSGLIAQCYRGEVLLSESPLGRDVGMVGSATEANTVPWCPDALL